MDEDTKPLVASTPAVRRSPPVPPETTTAEDTAATVDAHGTSNADGSTREEDSSSWALPDLVVAVYLLNPVLAGQCAALSGDVLGRVLPLAALAAAGRQRPRTTAAALAAATCLWRLHAAPLLVPVALILSKRSRGASVAGPSATVVGVESGRGLSAKGAGPAVGSVSTKKMECAANGTNGGYVGGGTRGRAQGKETGAGRDGNTDSLPRLRQSSDGRNKNHSEQRDGKNARNSTALGMEPAAAVDPLHLDFNVEAFVRLCLAFATWCAVILGACWLGTSGSWAFFRAAVGGQLLCEDLTPNAGLYWYFFAEVFPRFRGFFRVLFLSQPYVYVLPTSLRLGMFPEATVRTEVGDGKGKT